MANLSIQVSAAASPELRTIPRPLVTMRRPLHTGERVRNIGKLVSLKLVVAVAPLSSMCDTAEQAQPQSQRSPIEHRCPGWRELYRRECQRDNDVRRYWRAKDVND